MKTNMELVRLIILTCLVFFVDCSKKSRLEQKVDALDNLFQGKMFLVNDQLETGKQEREKLKEKLNNTLEHLEAMGNADGKTVENTNTEDRKSDLDMLTVEIDELKDKAKQTDRETMELSESVSRIKRGFHQEKIARKTDMQTVLDQLLEMQKYQNEMQKNLFNKMNDIITAQGNLTNIVNKLSETLETTLDNHRDEILQSNELIQKQVAEVMITTTNLESNKSTIAKQIQHVHGYVMPSFYCKYWLHLDDCLEKHFTEQQHLMNFIPGKHKSVWLFGGSTKFEGRVEVIYMGSRGTICDDNWDDEDATVVCRMLGYSGGTALLGPKEENGHSFGEGTGEILLDGVSCTGSEDSLFDCGHNDIGDHDCDHGEDAGVRCYPRPAVRLVGGNTKFEGRVEIIYQGRQGTVCDDDWDNNDARVVCRMLGYSGGTALQGTRSGGSGSPSHSFGAGSGETLLDDVDCSGSEQSLLDCNHNGIGVEDCNHEEDAGVICDS